MNKKKLTVNIAIYAIVLAIYNIITFAIPFKHVGVFWPAYIFGLVAILVQVGKKNENCKNAKKNCTYYPCNPRRTSFGE